MASNITLSAAVRQNLLPAEHRRADELTQNRLATGKRSTRARQSRQLLHLAIAQQPRQRPQLAARLDRPGAADARAADHGLSSLTKLVESGEVDRQAGASGPAAGLGRLRRVQRHRQPDRRNPGTHRRHAVTVANAALYSFDINVNGTGARTVNYTSDASATYAEIVAGLQADLATELRPRASPAAVTLSDRRRRQRPQARPRSTPTSTSSSRLRPPNPA